MQIVPIQAWVRLGVVHSHCRSTRRTSTRICTTTQLWQQERRLIPPYSTDREISVAIISRTVPITADWNVTVWEYETPAPLVEHYWSEQQQIQKQSTVTSLDPFGVIAWPGALVAAHELLQHSDLIQNATVLVLGSGVGVEVQVAAQLGAAHVYALDIHPGTLQLLSYGIPSHLSDKVSPIVFDLCCSHTPLPYLNTTDLMIVADVLYNPQLAQQVARRCGEAFREKSNVLITDSQRLVHNFVDLLQPYTNTAAWQERKLLDFTGSGILVDQDQTYNVTARVLWMNPVE